MISVIGCCSSKCGSWKNPFENFTYVIFGWLSILEYLFHRGGRTFFNCRNHIPGFFSSNVAYRIWLITYFEPTRSTPDNMNTFYWPSGIFRRPPSRRPSDINPDDWYNSCWSVLRFLCCFLSFDVRLLAFCPFLPYDY